MNAMTPASPDLEPVAAPGPTDEPEAVPEPSSAPGDVVQEWPEAEGLFRTLHAAVHPEVVRFCRRRMPLSAAPAPEEVAVDVFRLAWRRFDELPSIPGEQRAWLFGLARRLILDRVATSPEAVAIRLAEEHRAEDPVNDDGLAARRSDVVAVWDGLSARDQETIAFEVWEDLSAVETAQVLGVSRSAVWARRATARRRLRRLLHRRSAAQEASDPIWSDGP